MASWITGPEKPNYLRVYGHAALDGKFYVIGGMAASPSTERSNLCYVYNTSTALWSRIANFPFAARIAAAVAVDGKIYAFPADVEPGSDYYRLRIYSPTSNTWEGGATYTQNATNGIYLNGKIYFSMISDGYVLTFDVETQEFQAPIASPIRLYNSGFAASGSKLYFLAGRESGSNSSKFLIYDTIFGEWGEGKLPQALAMAGAAGYDNYVYAVGGVGDSGQWINTVYKIDVRNNSVAVATPLPISVWEPSCAATDGILCSYGGYVGSTSAYPNNKIYTLDIKYISVNNMSPAAGFVDENQPQTFNWELDTSPSDIAQQSAIFQWRGITDTTIRTININNATQSITLPAGTLSTDGFQWRVQVTGANGIASEYTAWMTLTTVDQPPLAPVNLYPSGSQEDGTKEIQFYWTHRSPYSTPQHAFELQITYNTESENPAWIDLSGLVEQGSSDYISEPNAIVPTDTNGSVGWRVRTYNSDGDASPWSAAAYFIVHPAPQAPTIISVETGKSRPEIRWQSTGQIGWQLQIRNGETLFYDSSEHYGEGKAHTPDIHLANGAYTVYLRIVNIRSLWSEWAEYPITVNTVQYFATTLTGESIINGASLSWTTEQIQEGEGLSAVYYVLRDGVPIAKMYGESWADYMAVGTHRYTIRTVDSFGNYTDSNDVEITIDVRNSTLALASAPGDTISLAVRLSERPQRDMELAVGHTSIQYGNRRYPVVRAAKNRTLTQSVVLTTTTREQFDALFALIDSGEILVYRDLYGTKIIGTIPSFPAQFRDRNLSQIITYVADFEIMISQCDYDEAVLYD